MTNQVFINDNDIIECQVIGDQTKASVEAMGEELARLSKELKTQHKPQLVLDNILRIGDVAPDGRKAVIELIKNLSYDRVAMLGNNGVIRFGANLLIRASGRAHKLQYFTDRSQAIAWLKQAKSEK